MTYPGIILNVLQRMSVAVDTTVVIRSLKCVWMKIKATSVSAPTATTAVVTESVYHCALRDVSTAHVYSQTDVPAISGMSAPIVQLNASVMDTQTAPDQISYRSVSNVTIIREVANVTGANASLWEIRSIMVVA